MDHSTFDPPTCADPAIARMPSRDDRLSPLDHAHLRWPQYDADEIAAVAAVLRSGRVNALVHGEQTRLFEAEFASFCQMPHAIAVANGTVALELAMRALGIGSGDEVIVPARSFFATAASVVAVGASPVFCDIDTASQTIDVASARALVTSRTRAILCVHLAGYPCDMDGLLALVRSTGLWLIEDCAQAHGATYKGRPVGSFGAAAAFSFCTDKIISTGGEGGMLLLRDAEHWRTAWAFKDHGKNPDKMRMPASGGGFRYVHDSFGTNMRLTEMQAAIGRIQLARLPDALAARRRNAATLIALLAEDGRFDPLHVPAHVGHAFYRLYMTVADRGPGTDRLATSVIDHLSRAGLPIGSGSCANMSREAAFGPHVARGAAALPVADDLGRRTIAYPVDPLLDDQDMLRLADATAAAFADVDVQEELSL
uniref:DegT/DnrJ/EryC1/StrS family aminotransferase n=1 Tax=uncultured Sphingomonas sp. TaxID=158754 RepID=UPI0035CA3656